MKLTKNAREYLIDGVASTQYGNEIANAIDDNAYTPPVVNGQVTVHVTPSQLQNLMATPVLLIPAIPNKIIQVTTVDYLYTYIAPVYTLASTDLTLAYSGAGGFMNSPAGGILDQTHNVEYAVSVPAGQIYRNQSVLLTAFNADPVGGNGLLTVIIAYNIVG